jgi:hypothetical protein
VSTRCHEGIARERRVGRYYDPATGQFLSVDPDVTETGQPYAYAVDDPVNATDRRGDSSVPLLDASQVEAAATTHAAPQNVCPLVPTTESNFEGSVPVLWHFSSVENIQGILRAGRIDEGDVSGPHALYGQGVYATDITPQHAAREGALQTSIALFNSRKVQYKVQAFVGFEVTGLPVGAEFPSYNQAHFPGSTNYYIPGSVDLHGRVVAYGTVIY